MSPISCPGCTAPLPQGATQCPTCGYAGAIGRAPTGWLARSARGRQVGTAVVVLAVFLGRCGVQVLSHADDVANVADLADGFDAFGDDEDPDAFDPEPLVPAAPTDTYVAPDGSFAVVFPAVAPITDNVWVDELTGIETHTLHQGDLHVRQIVLPYGTDPGPPAELPLLAAELSGDLGGSIVAEEPTVVAGAEAERVRIRFPGADPTVGREADAVVLGDGTGTYYELWHTPAPGEPADVGPLVAGFSS